MLTNLKREIQRQEMSEFLLESMSVNADDLKGSLLDDFAFAAIGAENDPDVKSLAEKIPEYDDQDDEIMNQVESLAESLFETQI